MTRGDAHKLVDELFDKYDAEEGAPANVSEPAQEERKLPEGKRVVRTKQSGDRVYCLDEVKKTRHWVTSPEVLKGLGFEIGDVTEVEDSEMLKFQMGAAIYKIDNDA